MRKLKRVIDYYSLHMRRDQQKHRVLVFYKNIKKYKIYKILSHTTTSIKIRRESKKNDSSRKLRLTLTKIILKLGNKKRQRQH